MLKLFILVALRNLVRYKSTTVVQLVGLAIGISCFLVIQAYVNHQKSVNKQFTHADSIYRVNLFRDDNKPQALTPLRLSGELTSNFSDITDATRISATSVSINHNQSNYAERALFTDSNVFRFFDFPFIEGDVHTALNTPNSVVLFSSLAIKYFGRNINVIGQTLRINGENYVVTGVIQRSELPHTLPETLLLPIERFYNLLPNQRWTEMWNFNATITFARIPDSSRVPMLNNTVSDYYDQRAKGLSSYKNNRVVFEPLLEVYLNNTTTRSLLPSGSKMMVNTFQVIALLILFLASVNFANLATAIAMHRSKEVGVRKAIGANKFQLMTQYLAESVLITVIAGIIALCIVYICIPKFNELMNVNIQFSFGLTTFTELGMLVLVIGLVSGSYPAFFLSSLQPALVLKGVVNTSKININFRKLLIVFQFAVAAFLLTASLVINWQMQHINNLPLGYERQNTLVVSRGADIYNAFKTSAMQLDFVESVTMSHTVPTKATRTSQIVRKPKERTTEIWVGNNPISYGYFETFGINLLAGRSFSKAFINDAYREDQDNITNSKGTIIINQTLAQTLGWLPEQAIGQSISLGNINDGLHDHLIVGVTEDTHYTNAKNRVPPMIYVLSDEPKDLSLRWLTIKLKEGSNIADVQTLSNIWSSLDNNTAFRYDWLNDLYNASYRNETLQMQLLNIFTLLAFIITIIGLVGLAVFTTEKRITEIAIRKVLGAKNSRLFLLLLNQFTILIVIANAIAIPFIYWKVSDWLNSFIYRIDFPITVFCIGFIISLAIAYLATLTVTYRAIAAKPVDALANN